MYLHQGLVDNLILLQTSKKTPQKLLSIFTYKIHKINQITTKWVEYIETPNSITKLSYQYNYFITDIQFEVYNNWNYITGIIKYNIWGVLPTAIRFNNKLLFQNCIEHGVIPDDNNVRLSIMHNRLEMFELCVENGYIPCQDTISIAAEYSNTEIFKSCIKYGVIPDDATMVEVVWNKNREIFDICLKYIDQIFS